MGDRALTSTPLLPLDLATGNMWKNDSSTLSPPVEEFPLTGPFTGATLPLPPLALFRPFHPPPHESSTCRDRTSAAPRSSPHSARPGKPGPARRHARRRGQHRASERLPWDTGDPRSWIRRSTCSRPRQCRSASWSTCTDPASGSDRSPPRSRSSPAAGHLRPRRDRAEGDIPTTYPALAADVSPAPASSSTTGC